MKERLVPHVLGKQNTGLCCNLPSQKLPTEATKDHTVRKNDEKIHMILIYVIVRYPRKATSEIDEQNKKEAESTTEQCQKRKE